MGEVTIKDIADVTGVSYATVSRTLNNRSGVHGKTRDKILKAAAELGYHPNLQARSLKTNRTYSLALIVPDISNPFFSDIALAVNDYAYERGYTTVLCSANWDPEIERRQLLQLLGQRVDGLIYKPSRNVLPEVERFGSNCVIISHLSEASYDFIEVDNLKGGQLAAEHLASCGYKRIAFIGGREDSTSNGHRLTGMIRGLKKAGLEIDESLYLYGPFSMVSGYKLTKQVMESDNPPDGIFCGNDLIALGAYEYLVEEGYRVPEDIGIVGYDDISFCSLPQIQLTSVSFSRSQMGRQAAEILIRKIEDGVEDDKLQHVILQPKLVSRRSTRK